MFLYKKEMYSKFNFKFNGLENIQQSYSQCLQDMFVLAVLKGKRDGVYLEIGANQPVFINNTYLLESQFNWRGISVDIDYTSRDMFKQSGRTSKFILSDALTVDYENEMIAADFPKQVDYLSLDIEPNIQTLNCLKRFSLDKFRFSVITFETDVYSGNPQVLTESRELFKKYNYILVAGNISNLDDTHPFEDWYVDSNLITTDIIDRFKRSSDTPIAAHKYMLGAI